MAAGQGFKTFATGDILTAADTNGYLMSQTVMVFADSSARSTAITSPQQGMVSFLKGTNSTEYYNGSAWVAISGASSGGMTLLSTTSLSGVSTTISSISGSYTNLAIYGVDIDSGTTNANVLVRFNGDSASNYNGVGYQNSGGSYSGQAVTANTFIPGFDARTGGTPGNFIVDLYRYTDTSRIMGRWSSVLTASSPSDQLWATGCDFRYNASAAISSVTITNANSASMTGTIYIYGVK